MDGLERVEGRTLGKGVRWEGHAKTGHKLCEGKKEAQGVARMLFFG